MDETGAWTAFLATGSVLDYLRYTSLKNAAVGIDTQEEYNEDQYGRSDDQGTEYR